MAVNPQAIDAEIRSVAAAMQTSWPDFAIYCQAKIFECSIAGAVSSYTIGGRTVTKDLNFWERALNLANRMVNAEQGGVVEMPVSFRSRR
jgi:photosystem II stability/assembly factor-like uncharacterized protein